MINFDPVLMACLQQVFAFQDFDIKTIIVEMMKRYRQYNEPKEEFSFEVANGGIIKVVKFSLTKN